MPQPGGVPNGVPWDIVMRGRTFAPVGAREAEERRLAALVMPAAPLPAEYFPPVGAETLFAAGQVTLGPGPLGFLPIPGATFTIPPNTIGVMRGLTLNVNNILTTTSILFSVLINGAPAVGFSNLLIFPRVAASVSVDFPPNNTKLRIPDGAVISVEAQVTDVGTYQLGAQIRGWFWPKGQS